MDHPETILIVDDEEQLRTLLRDFLLGLNYHVIEANSGAQALAICESERPDMILLDMVMPGLSGLDVCLKLKADPKLMDIPVIFISGFSQIGETTRSFQAGAVDYVDKPFRFEEVRARVQTHLQLSKQRRQLMANNEELRIALHVEEVINRKLIELNEKLREAEELQGRFIGKMRNEINNPLGVISAMAGQIAQGDLSEPAAKLLAGLIQAESFGLDFQMRNIFCAGELEAGDCIPAASRVNVPSIIRDVLDTWSHAATGRALTFEVKGNTDPWLAEFPTDGPKVHLILSNLVSNAIKFSPQGGIVRIELEGRPVHLVLRVANQGPGIPEAQRPLIFQRFRPLDASRAEGNSGHGLGLAVVQALAELLGGQVSVDSGANEGVVFTVALPMIPLDLESETAADGNLFIFPDREER